MSANTTIQEGGKGYPFGPVKCLMVEGDDGTYYPWYPEADRQMDSLSVDKNGIYQASKYGVYGWSRVSVNVPQTGSVTGRDPQTGQEVTVTADPETGELVETVVPVEIRVIAPPTNPYGTYVDGQTITKDGMVVKAYDANGNETQTVPIGEITINPTTAVYDSSKDTAEYSNGNGINAIAVSAHNIYTEKRGGVDYYGKYSLANIGEKFIGTNTEKTIPNDAVYYLTKYNGNVYLAVKNDNSVARYEYLDGVLRMAGNVTGSYGKEFTSTDFFAEWFNSVSESTANPNRVDVDTLTMTRGWGAKQTITVSWPRPGDGAILETTFDILVGPRSGQGDD